MATPRDIEDIYELSPIQAGLLYELTRSPDTGTYVEQVSVTLAGELDPRHFARAWQRVVDRHPILRTGFRWRRGGTPLQIVHRRAALRIEQQDWRDVPDDEWDAHYQAWLDADRMRPFDLNRPPLMRATLIRRAADTWVFAWRFSHLVMDGWSFGIAIADFLDGYRALRRGTAPLNLPTRPYSDYVAWWREHPSDDDSARYWRETLAGVEHGDPLGQGGGTVTAGEPSHHFVHLTLPGLADRIQRVAREQRLTAATIVQGAWSVVLARHLGTGEVVTGSTTAHRPRDLPGAAGVLGPLIVTLPARARIDPRRPAAQWLRDFQAAQARGREHDSVPLVEVQRLAGWDASPIESNVAFENAPMPELDLADIRLKVLGYSYDGRPHFPLTLVILPGDDMPLRLVYDRRRFDRPGAELLVRHLRALLESFTAAPDTPLRELPMLSAPEKRILDDHAKGDLAEPVADTVLHRFADQVARAPDAVAVTCGPDRLTYGELDRRAARIAGRLTALGAGRGGLVALCLNRSADMIAGIVGALRSGAAYLPLDLANPPDRLAYLVADSGADVLLTDGDLVPFLPENARRLPLARIDALDDSDEDTGAEPEAITGSDRMYVLYTSGSTGRPKGVPILHRDVAQFMTAILAEMDIGPDDVWAMFHPYGFDLSVYEVWGALTTGARLRVLTEEEVHSPAAQLRVIEDEGVTVLNQTPSAFDLVVEADGLRPPGEPAGPSPLRYVVLGGERLDPSRLRPWARRHGVTAPRLVNGYGITETTIFTTWYELTEHDVFTGGGSPIGRALRHQRVLVTDDAGRQLPMGCVGEIRVSGASIANGYLGRLDLTAERFVPDPAGGLQYRTGDLGRLRADGTLEFIGRNDHQVKIRGFRVEPGEAEAVLAEQPGVTGAAVVARPGPDGDARLVAYVVADPETAAGLGERLRARLPSYLVPSALITMAELPRNPNGKVDRRALPEPGRADRRNVPYTEPRTPAEHEVAELVREVLNTERIGVLDDLTDHGLHSLGAMRIAMRLRAERHVDVPLTLMQQDATVASLAELIDRSPDPREPTAPTTSTASQLTG
ncbi:amino acid adenylation domain-containing protein [Actinomadura pelletieri DSM 43383]|uniref:Amino acid adenylation domain-containing protein n=1 Tax=Actinomadura pelletieri DSM 43383 TaxID=1120940 RepID=A0A495QTZ6_9ACTN|nr:non-ribosomal peptide synthetase [Actinomadura pelletieri]RKS76990.1 amino acid adenylation domain-containing protein [Actinomadura pelletieri DSM 43383]